MCKQQFFELQLKCLTVVCIVSASFTLYLETSVTGNRFSITTVMIVMRLIIFSIG